LKKEVARHRAMPQATGMSDAHHPAGGMATMGHPPCDRPPRQALGEMPAEVRAAWRGRYVTEAELRVRSLLDHAEAALSLGSAPATIRWREVAEGADAGRLREVLLALDLGEGSAALSGTGTTRPCGPISCSGSTGVAARPALTSWNRFSGGVAEVCLRELDVPPLEGEQRADNVVQQVVRTCTRRTGRVLTHGGLRVALSGWQVHGKVPGMTTSTSPYRGFRFPAEVIEHAV